MSELPISAATTPAPLPRETAPVPPRSGPSFSDLVGAVARQVDRGNGAIDHTLRSGGSLDAAQLIALQAGIYRYSEAVDLLAKLVDRGAQAIKTPLQSSG